MSKLDTLQGKALELAGQIGDGLRNVPDHAGHWIRTGAAIGAARAGSKVATRAVRRNPALVAAAAVAAAGAGLLIYAVRRRKLKANGAEGGPAIEGQARRVEAKRAPARRAPARKTAARRTSRAAGATTAGADNGSD